MDSTKKVVQRIVLAGIIINKQGQILILQRNSDEDVFPNLWELPSGKREPFENSDDSLLREIIEETGLSVEIIMPVSVFDYKIEKSDEIRDTTQVNFLTKAIDPSLIRLSHEHQNFAWIEEQDINKYELSIETKKTIKNGFFYAKKIAVN